jgi:hypothetical protein
VITSDLQSYPISQRFIKSERVLSGWDANQQSLSLFIWSFDRTLFTDAPLVINAQQAAATGKTIYVISVSYIDNVPRYRAASLDPTSHCFSD